jgi:hypothetical protein
MLGRTPGAGLFVAGQQMTGEPEGLPPLRRGSLLGLETTPRTILKAMICSRSRRFSFASLNDLATNIAIRAEVVRAMRGVMSGQLPISFIQSANDLRMPVSAWRYVFSNPFGALLFNGQPLTWQSLPGIEAHQAIESLFVAPARLECLSGVEVIMLVGVEQAIGAARFDQLHPQNGPGGSALWGIGVPLLRNGEPGHIPLKASSARRHLVLVRYRTLDQNSPHVAPVDNDSDPMTGPISQADMVPGDYVFMNSISDYDVVHRGGAWNGENAIYMGANAFYGLGLGNTTETEADLQKSISWHYNNDPITSNGLFSPRPSPASPSEMLWTLLASPTLNGDPAEAGEFVR